MRDDGFLIVAQADQNLAIGQVAFTGRVLGRGRDDNGGGGDPEAEADSSERGARPRLIAGQVSQTASRTAIGSRFAVVASARMASGLTNRRPTTIATVPPMRSSGLTLSLAVSTPPVRAAKPAPRRATAAIAERCAGFGRGVGRREPR